MEKKLTDLTRLELERTADVLLEYFENEDPEGLRGEEIRLANKVVRVLDDVGLLPEVDHAYMRDKNG